MAKNHVTGGLAKAPCLRNYLYLNHAQKSLDGRGVWKIDLGKWRWGIRRARHTRAVRSDVTKLAKPAYLRLAQFSPEIGRPKSLRPSKNAPRLKSIQPFEMDFKSTPSGKLAAKQGR